MAHQVKEIPTKPFDGQKPGTSGLRKRSVQLPPATLSNPASDQRGHCPQGQGVPTTRTRPTCSVERSRPLKPSPLQHYTENFIQSIIDSINAPGATLVIGGDGRYFSPETVQTILKIGSANGVKRFIVGKDSILSTPAASNVIRKYKADGGILLTASHNPGGPDNDFGIKYNVSNGGPAPENVTNKIYEVTKSIARYNVIEAPPVRRLPRCVRRTRCMTSPCHARSISQRLARRPTDPRKCRSLIPLPITSYC